MFHKFFNPFAMTTFQNFHKFMFHKFFNYFTILRVEQLSQQGDWPLQDAVDGHPGAARQGAHDG